MPSNIDNHIKKLKEEVELMERIVSLYERYQKIQQELVAQPQYPKVPPYQPDCAPTFLPQTVDTFPWEPSTICHGTDIIWQEPFITCYGFQG